MFCMSDSCSSLLQCACRPSKVCRCWPPLLQPVSLRQVVRDARSVSDLYAAIKRSKVSRDSFSFFRGSRDLALTTHNTLGWRAMKSYVQAYPFQSAGMPCTASTISSSCFGEISDAQVDKDSKTPTKISSSSSVRSLLPWLFSALRGFWRKRFAALRNESTFRSFLAAYFSHHRNRLPGFLS